MDLARTREARLSGPAALPPRFESIPAALESGAAQDAPFITFHGLRDQHGMDARDALATARMWAATLMEHGVRPGDRVPILLPTGRVFVGALLGTMFAGAIPVPLASPMTFGSVDRFVANLAAIVADAGATCIVTSTRVAASVAEHPVLRETLRAVLTEASQHVSVRPLPLPSVSGSDTAILQYTSGTTGRPKGVVVSQRALAANAGAIAHAARITAQDVGVSWLPMFHDMGLIGVLLTAVHHPYPMHLLAPELFVMRPERWLHVLHSTRGTISAAPNFAYGLCADRARDIDSLRLDAWRVALNGSEPVLRPTVEKFINRFGPLGFNPGALTPVYGLAECTLAVTWPEQGGVDCLRMDRHALESKGVVTPSDGDAVAEAVSVGRPVVGTTVTIRGQDGSVLVEGVVGEVVVEGPGVMDGYFNNPEVTESVLVGGKLRTGDLGFVRGGALYIVGRAKDVIIKAGRNVYPADVERVVGDVAGVRPGGLAVFARANADAGTDDIVVVVETTENDPSQRERIVREIRGEVLAVLGVKPDGIHLWPVGALPRTTSGKVRRAACAERLAREETSG